MKKIQLIIGAILIATAFTTVNAQDASAALQVDATDQGFLMPRVTTTQMNAIATPAEGLQVYNTTTKKVMLFDGTTWVAGATGTAKFVDGTTATDAVFTGGNVGIGTTTPTAALTVNSTDINDSNKYGQYHQVFVANEATTGTLYALQMDIRTDGRHK